MNQKYIRFFEPKFVHAAPHRPNTSFHCILPLIIHKQVLFIMPDDLGWGNVGYHNPSNLQINTPNIDSLAQSGLQLERMYVYRGCSPSRSAFQTGRLPIHVSMDNGDGGITNPTHGIPGDMTGFAEKLKEANYKTYLFGKWDAGFANWKQVWFSHIFI